MSHAMHVFPPNLPAQSRHNQGQGRAICPFDLNSIPNAPLSFIHTHNVYTMLLS